MQIKHVKEQQSINEEECNARQAAGTKLLLQPTAVEGDPLDSNPWPQT